MPCIFTERAEKDLEAIAEYIAQDSPSNAFQFLRKLRERCIAITAAPEAYPLCPQYGEGIRKVVFGNYLLFYQLHAAEVVILHVTHGGRHPDNIAF
jgi:toxin ParE1/3/4